MVDHGPTSALKVAANNAWWNMNRNSICDFASLSGTAISDSASLFEAAFLATKGVLQCSDDEALTIMGKRLAHDSNDQAFAAELMELDCAIEMFDHTDHEALRNDMKAAARNLDLIENFEMELQSTRQDMLKAKTKRSDANRPRPPTSFDQQEAALWIPPRSHIWIGNTTDQWWGHLVPFKRIVVPWTLTDGDSHAACMVVIKRLWLKHFKATGETKDQCPFNIF